MKDGSIIFGLLPSFLFLFYVFVLIFLLVELVAAKKKTKTPVGQVVTAFFSGAQA